MHDDAYAARPPGALESERKSRQLRTDREVLEDVEQRLVRVETKQARGFKSLGLKADGSKVEVHETLPHGPAPDAPQPPTH